MAALPPAVLRDQQVDVLLGLPRQEQSAQLRPALRQLQLLQQLALLVQEGQTALFGERPELEEGGDEESVVGGGEGSGSEPAVELVEDTAYPGLYLM